MEDSNVRIMLIKNGPKKMVLKSDYPDCFNIHQSNCFGFQQRKLGAQSIVLNTCAWEFWMVYMLPINIVWLAQLWILMNFHVILVAKLAQTWIQRKNVQFGDLNYWTISFRLRRKIHLHLRLLLLILESGIW